MKEEETKYVYLVYNKQLMEGMTDMFQTMMEKTMQDTKEMEINIKELVNLKYTRKDKYNLSIMLHISVKIFMLMSFILQAIHKLKL